MIVTINDLKDIRRKNINKTIILTTGTFDLFHYEHLRYLEDAKKLGDILVVAIKDNKGAYLKEINRPIIDENQRIEIINALKCVDFTLIVPYDEDFYPDVDFDNIEQRQWLQIFCRTFEYLSPDILYYEKNELLLSARKRIFKKYKIRGVDRERTAIITTSKIINTILKLNKKLDKQTI